VLTWRASRMCSRVCGMGPSTADTTRMAPSICRRGRQQGGPAATSLAASTAAAVAAATRRVRGPSPADPAAQRRR
jgi:hypothetical protein